MFPDNAAAFFSQSGVGFRSRSGKEEANLAAESGKYRFWIGVVPDAPPSRSKRGESVFGAFRSLYLTVSPTSGLEVLEFTFIAPNKAAVEAICTDVRIFADRSIELMQDNVDIDGPGNRFPHEMAHALSFDGAHVECCGAPVGCGDTCVECI